MSGDNSAVFGIYSTHVSADAAVDTLKTSGFRSTDVSVLFPPVATLADPGVIIGSSGALIGLGITEHQGSRYERRMRTGGILVSVRADDHHWASKGKRILEQTGAEDVSLNGAARCP